MSEWDEYFEQLIDAVDNLRAVHFKVEEKANRLHSDSGTESHVNDHYEAEMRERLVALGLENKRLKDENRHLNQQLQLMSASLSNQSSTIPPENETDTAPIDDSLYFPDLSNPPQPISASNTPVADRSLPPFNPPTPPDVVPEIDRASIPRPILPQPSNEVVPSDSLQQIASESNENDFMQPPQPVQDHQKPDDFSRPQSESTSHEIDFPAIDDSDTATQGRPLAESGEVGHVVDTPETVPRPQPATVVVEPELEEDNSESLAARSVDTFKPNISPQAAIQPSDVKKNVVNRQPVDFEAQRRLKAGIRDAQRRIRIIEADEGPTSKSIIAEITTFYKMYHEQESTIKAPLQSLQHQIDQESLPISQTFQSQKDNVTKARDSELEPLIAALGGGETVESIEHDYENHRNTLQLRLDKAITRLSEIDANAPRGFKGFFTSNAKKIKNIEQMDLLRDEIDEIETQLRRIEGQYLDRLEQLKQAPKGEEAEEIQNAIDARTQHYADKLNQIALEEKAAIESVVGRFLGEKRDIEELVQLKLDDLHADLSGQEASFIQRFPRAMEIKPLAAELFDLEKELDLVSN